MELLLDTHALLWWLAGDPSLSQTATEAISDESNGVFVSAASLWEIATKHRIGKLPGIAAVLPNLVEAIGEQGFVGLPIDLRHGRAAGGLPGPHRDPFDRMLIAQVMLGNMVLVSNERVFDVYGVRRLW